MNKKGKDTLKGTVLILGTTLIGTGMVFAASHLSTSHASDDSCLINLINPSHQIDYLNKGKSEDDPTLEKELRVIPTTKVDTVYAADMREEEIYLYEMMGYVYNSETGFYEKYEVKTTEKYPNGYYVNTWYGLVSSDTATFKDQDGYEYAYDYEASKTDDCFIISFRDHGGLKG